MPIDVEPRLTWLERGEGEPVILLHGLMGRMEHWEATLEGLRDVCRPIAPSLPLFDPSLPDPSVRTLSRQVIRLMDALEIQRAVVGGNSLGGHVAIEVALAEPERVSGLILAGSSGLFGSGARRGVPHRPPRQYVRARLEEAVYDRERVTSAWVASVHELLSARRTALRAIQLMRATRRENVASRLGRLRVPTLLVWGTEDRITPPGVARRFHRMIRGSDLMMLARCGHVPMLERAEAFTAIVAVWIAASRARRAATVAMAGDAR